MIKITNTGYKQSLYFADENVYGSATTVDQPIGLVQSVNPTETNNLIKIRTMGGTRDYSNIVAGKFEVSGSFDYYLQGGAFLRMGMGEDTGTSSGTVDAGPRIHTGAALGSSAVHVMGSAASPDADAFPSFTLEFADTEDTTGAKTENFKRVYNGCRVNTMSISGTVDEAVNVSADWIAQGVTISTTNATSVTDATTDPYVYYQGAIYSTSGTITYNTALTSDDAICEVNSFDFSVNNNLEPVWYICGTSNAYQTKRGLKALLAKGRDYDANLNLHFANKTMYERFLGATGATEPQDTLSSYQVVIDFVRTGTIGSTPKLQTDRYLRVLLENCKFNDVNIPGSPEDIVSETMGVSVESAKIYVVDSDVSYQA